MSTPDRSIDRRTLLRGAIVLGTSAAAGAALIGCSTATPGASAASSSRTPGPLPASSPSGSAAMASSVVGAPRILLAYFSRAGENYYYGGRRNLKVGNTRRVANKIAALIPVDVYEIKASDPYPDSYDATVARNVREQDADARPAIATALPDIGRYDVLLLGSPIWNVRPPMIMSTFVDALDVAGTTIYPFVTHAVSGLGRTIDVYSDLAPNSTIGQGLAVRGETSRTSRDEAQAWLNDIGLLP